MGKANKVKKEYVDSIDMVDLIQTLKDIADNKVYTLMGQKDKFRRFGESFIEFFRMISFSKDEHLLIKNENPAVAALVVTVEGSFLGEFNNKTIRRALELKNEHESVKFIGVGEKSIERLSQETPDFKVFTGMEAVGMYQMAIEVKDYLVDEVMSGNVGKVYVVYNWPKSLEMSKPRCLQLLPCDELLTKQSQFVENYSDVLQESHPKEIIGYLCNLWITTRLFEIFLDTVIASASAQASFLDDSLDKMEKEKKKTFLKYRKAKKGDIDKSLRETFSARMIQLK